MKTKKIVLFALVFVLIMPLIIGANDDIKYTRKHGVVYATLDVVDYPIKDLLKSIAKEKKMDLIFSTSVHGFFSGRFTKVSVNSLLTKILRSNGLDYEKLGGIYRIDTSQNIAQYREKQQAIMKSKEQVEPLQTRIININYADISSIRTNVQKLLSQRGRIELDVRTKKLIITEIPSHFALIYKFIDSLDIPVKQVLIKVKFVQISHSNLEHIEFYWQANNQNSTQNNKYIGGSYTGTAAKSPSTGAGLFHIGVVKNTMELDAVLNMLASENKAEVRSHPQILAMNNETAIINIGNKIPLRMEDESGNLTTQLTYVGTQIKVTPQITPDNKIILKIHPEVSSIAGQFGSGVLIDTNQIDTQVILKDRETAVIGGMVRDEKSNNKGGVPILSDIPIIGALFRSKDNTNTRVEILVFVTPYIQEASNE